MSERISSRVVIDASVVIKLWAPARERHAVQAQQLVEEYERGAVRFVAPHIMGLEVVNIAARKWQLGEPALLVLVAALDDLGVTTVTPPLDRVAHWSMRGLSAYDAAYVAVAEAEGVALITDDEQIVALAPELAVALRDWAA